MSSEAEKVTEPQEITLENKGIVEVFNRFVVNIVPSFKISTENDFDTNFLKTEDTVLNGISEFGNHANFIIKAN